MALARAVGARVLLVDAPLRQGLLDLADDPEESRAGLRTILNAAGRRLGVETAFVPPGLVPDDDFADLTHLLPAGAVRYSRWLGEAIAVHYDAVGLE